MPSRALVVVVGVSIVVGASYAAATSPPGRAYSQVRPEEARRFVEDIIKRRLVPAPSPGPSSWELPDAALSAQGIKIDTKDYVIFAPAEPTFNHAFLEGNLATIFRQLRGESHSSDGERYFMAWLNGILYSTADLEVVDALSFYQPERGRWATKRVIEKGGYLWCLGEDGVYLIGSADSRMLIAFNEPLAPFPPGVAAKAAVDLLVDAAGSGVVLRVAERTIRVR